MVVPAPNLSDRALQDYKLVLEALNEKSEKAFSELMHRYKDSIYYMLLKMVNNKDDADEYVKHNTHDIKMGWATEPMPFWKVN